ncbi:hypothetical protein GQ53DRAFT_186420 [Thozetella sp. PMI_491]|nr:hypothetical protein GQ53DRAFT_186420 [Thozetella sp. PMI_491]
MLDLRNQTISNASDKDVEYQSSIHLSAAIASTVVLLLLQYHIRQHGYKLSRTWYRSTDCQMWVAMGSVSLFWTILVLHSALIWEDYGSTPCRESFRSWECAGRLAFTPWILNGMVFWWVLRYIFHRTSLGSRRAQNGGNRKHGLARIPRIPKPWSWRIEPLTIFIITATPTAWTAVAALKVQLYTLGMLMFATMFILLDAIQEYPYHLTMVHRYAMDDIRVPVLSPLDSGMVYILPSRKYGFDAAFCHKLEHEHRILDSIRQFVEPVDIVIGEWNLAKCRAAVRKVLTSQADKIDGHQNMIKDLAYWLYPRDDDTSTAHIWGEPGLFSSLANRWRQLWAWVTGSYIPPDEQYTECKTRPGFTLIGRDTSLALLFWEYLVFERRWQLDDEMEQNVKEGHGINADSEKKFIAFRDKVWRLRAPKYTGVGPTDNFGDFANIPACGPLCSSPTDGSLACQGELLVSGSSSLIHYQTCGSSPGWQGFLEAVSEVYRILGRDQLGKKGPRCDGNRADGGDVEMYGGHSVIAEAEAHCSILVERVIEEVDKARVRGDPILMKGSIHTTINLITSVKDYAARLWDACWAECPSTFGALYLWTTVWYIDVGNIGFHTTPLLPKGDPKNWLDDGPDYMTVWRIRWRHRWHTAILCQLVVLLPTMINSFLSLVAIV